MNILITDRNDLLSEHAKQLVTRRMLFALSRFGNQIDRVNVQVLDVNGPRGGLDKDCSVTVKLKKIGSVKVSATDASAGKCVSSAIDRIGRAVARKVERRRNRGRDRLSIPMIAEI